MVYELVAAGMMINATTVVLEPIFWSRELSPASQSAHAISNEQPTSQRLDEHVDTLVPELVSASREQVDGVLEVKVVVSVEVSADEVVDLFLGLDVQVLELVHRRELLDVKTVRQDTVCP